jgi:integrase
LKIIKGSLADRWRDRPLIEITHLDIEAVVEEARTRGIPGLKRRKESGNADGSARDLHFVLAAFFKWCKGSPRRLIATNPVESAAQPGEIAERDRALDDDEIRWFWAATARLGPLYGNALRVLLLTGQRREEISRMEIKELTRADGRRVLDLPPARTKNGLRHVLPLPKLTVQLLAAARKFSGPGRYVFSQNGVVPIRLGSRAKTDLDRAMLEIARRERGQNFMIAGWRLDEKARVVSDWRIHDLRRTAVNGLQKSRVLPHIAEHIINHRSGTYSGVLKIYQTYDHAPERLAGLVAWEDYLLRRILRVRTGDVIEPAAFKAARQTT